MAELPGPSMRDGLPARIRANTRGRRGWSEALRPGRREAVELRPFMRPWVFHQPLADTW